ncbi:MAG: tetratricopeptide repeat protein [Anaerolineales bacterium]|nr:tetratricopeptide repeat protein [Anaerolineales bacterium]
MAQQYTFAEQLKGFRKRAQLTQAELCEAVLGQPSLNTLKNWESGRTRPRDGQDVVRVAQALQLTAAETEVLLNAYENGTSGSVAAGHSQTADNEAVGPAQVVPRRPQQLPARPLHFVGRLPEMQRLRQHLLPDRIILLWGPGGMGKSTLVAELLYHMQNQGELARRFPDGIVWHQFTEGQAQAAIALEQIALSWGEQVAPTPRAAAQRALAGRQALLVLESTELVADLEDILAIRGQCGVLLTSQRQDQPAHLLVPVEPLSTHQSVQLLRKAAAERLAPATASQICALLGGLPLAIFLASRYLVAGAMTGEQYLAWLQTNPLAALAHGKRPQDSIASLLTHSLAQLTADARLLLAAIGALGPAPFGKALLLAALDWPAAALHQPLTELLRYGFVQPLESGYTVSHHLIYLYAQSLTEANQISPDRLPGYFLELASGPAERVGDWFPANQVHITHLVTTLIGLDNNEAALKLAAGVERFFERFGYWAQWHDLLARCLQAAQDGTNSYFEARFLNLLGMYYDHIGEVAQAAEQYNHALELAHQLDVAEIQLKVLINLGIAARKLGDISQAISYHEQAVALSQTAGDERSTASLFLGLGNSYNYSGQPEKARQLYRKSADLYRQLNDLDGQASALGSIGNVYVDLGQLAEAIAHYEQSLALFEQVDSQWGIALTGANLGKMLLQQGQAEAALTRLNDAIQRLETMGDRRGVATNMGNRAQVYHALGQTEQAIVELEAAIALSDATANIRVGADQRGMLGQLHFAQGEWSAARRHYEQALAIARQHGYRRLVAEQLLSLAELCRRLSAVEEAIDYYRQALPLLKEIRSPRLAEVEANLRQLS